MPRSVGSLVTAPDRDDRLRIDAPIHGRHAPRPSGALILVIEISMRLETVLVTSLLAQGADVVRASDLEGARKLVQSVAADGVIVTLAAGVGAGLRPGMDVVSVLPPDVRCPVAVLPEDRLSAEERDVAKRLPALVMKARHVKRVFYRDRLLSFLLGSWVFVVLRAV